VGEQEAVKMVEHSERRPRHKEAKPRRKSVTSLIQAAQRLGLPIRRLNPDGSVDIGEPHTKDEKDKKREIIL
jgi:hypothetical protein